MIKGEIQSCNETRSWEMNGDNQKRKSQNCKFAYAFISLFYTFYYYITFSLLILKFVIIAGCVLNSWKRGVINFLKESKDRVYKSDYKRHNFFFPSLFFLRSLARDTHNGHLSPCWETVFFLSLLFIVLSFFFHILLFFNNKKNKKEWKVFFRVSHI